MHGSRPRSVTRLVDAARSTVDEWAAGEGLAYTWDELGEEHTLDWARAMLHHTLHAVFKDLEVYEGWQQGLDSYRVTG